MLEVKIVNKSNNQLPKYETSGSAGMDLRADIAEPVVLKPMERKLIPTGVHISLPKGCVGLVAARSGLSIKHGITCVNGIGVIDSDYTGNVGAILINCSAENFTINPGDRIAQLIITKYEQVKWEQVTELDKTERGDKGYGHSGVK